MKQKPDPNGGIMDRILELTEGGRFDELEAFWLERLDETPTRPELLRDWMRLMKRAGQLERAETLVALSAEARLEAGKPRTALRVLLAVLPSLPRSAALRPWLTAAVRAVHAETPELEELLRISGLAGGDGSLVEAYREFLAWRRLTPGQVWAHTEWGEGIVAELDPAGGSVILDFTSHPARQMTVQGARKHLKYLEPDSFLALRAREPATLAKQAETDPAALVRRALADQPDRRMRQGDLKQILTGGIVDPGGWNGWWGRARQAVKLDPYIDFDSAGGAHAVLSLRETPLTFEEEISGLFFDPDADEATRAALIRQLARHQGTLDPDLVRRVAARLGESAALAGDSPARRLELAYMLGDLAAAAPDVGVEAPDPAEPLEAIRDYGELTRLNHIDYAITEELV